MIKALKFLGDIDGGIAAAAAAWGGFDRNHMGIALAVAGIAGGVGMILNAISRASGGTDVVDVKKSQI
jgi:hypothetical protein